MTYGCPLGYGTFEGLCPRAPCIECMRALGDHMIAEFKIMARQACHAEDKSDGSAYDILRLLMDDIGAQIMTRRTKQEIESDFKNYSARRAQG